MLLTVFIISLTLRTEPKLQFRMIHFRPSADCTFMFGNSCASSHIPLEFLSPVDLFGIQVHHIPRCHKEHDEIEQGSKDRKFADNAHSKKGKQKHNAIDRPQPFNLDRQKEHEQNFHFRKSRRKGKKNRHIDIVGAETQGTCQEIKLRPNGRDPVRMKDVMISHHQKAARYGKEHSLEQIDIIPVGPPRPLQCCADRTIEIQHDQRKKKIAAFRRNQDPGKEPPDLPMQDRIGIQRQVKDQPAASV